MRVPSGLLANETLIVRDFRLRLVRAIAFETEYAKRSYEQGVSEKLATELGVTPDILREATEYVRRGFRPDGMVSMEDVKGIIEQRLWVTVADRAKVRSMAKARRMTMRELTRSILHYGMLSQFEPARAGVVNVRINGRRTRLGHSSFTSISVSKGLLAAIRQRAAGVGMPVSTYVRSWVLAYVRGELPDLAIRPVPRQGMYDDATNYLLPTCWQDVHIVRNPGPRRRRGSSSEQATGS
jgi:hypothetical protein